MSDIYVIKLQGLALFLCEQAFKAKQAVAISFYAAFADVTRSGLHCVRFS